MWFGGGMFLWLLLLALLALGIYYLLRSSRRVHHVHYERPVPRRRDALEILNERYARGEITREQLLEMRREIEH